MSWWWSSEEEEEEEEGEYNYYSGAGVKLITPEEVKDMVLRFTQLVTIELPSPAKQITNAPISRSGGKLPLGEKPKLLKPIKDPESIELRSGGKLPLGKKPKPLKPKEEPESIELPTHGKLSLFKKINPAKAKEGPKSIPKSIKLRSRGKLPYGKKPNPSKHEEDPESIEIKLDERLPIPEAWKCKAKETMKNKPDSKKPFSGVIAVKTTAHKLATAALSYLRGKGQYLELVEACLYESGKISMGHRVHFNFKAKSRYDSPVEMYFGQLRQYGDYRVVECCVSLGESDSLPDEPDNRGCQYCSKYVHHPEGGCEGIKWGLLRWSKKKQMLYVI